MALLIRSLASTISLQVILIGLCGKQKGSSISSCGKLKKLIRIAFMYDEYILPPFKEFWYMKPKPERWIKNIRNHVQMNIKNWAYN